jgi:hypothetical protein
MKTSDVTIHQNSEITVNNGPFAGTIFTFGDVSFPDENQPILSFRYYLIKGDVERSKEFEKEIGDLLVELIQEGLKNNEIIYRGGT